MKERQEFLVAVEQRIMLQRAAEIIETEGYTSGAEGMKGGDGPKCLLGAVAKAADLPFTPYGPVREYYDMLEAAGLLPGNPSYERAYSWSDDARFGKHWWQTASEKRGQKKVAKALREMAAGATFQEATR